MLLERQACEFVSAAYVLHVSQSRHGFALVLCAGNEGTFPEEVESPSSAVLPVLTALQSQMALPIGDIHFHGGSARVTPKRPAWADEVGDNEENVASQHVSGDESAVPRVSDQAQNRAPGCHGLERERHAAWAEQFLRSRKRSASFLQACAQLLQQDLGALCEDVADLMIHNHGWAHFFRTTFSANIQCHYI